MNDEMHALIGDWHDANEAGCCDDEGPFCVESKAWARGYIAGRAAVVELPDSVTPKRIQRQRTKGWQMPIGAVYVGRGTRWGNPFTIRDATEAGYSNPRRACISHYRAWIKGSDAYADFYDLGIWTYDRRWVRNNLHRIKGDDLACFCPLDVPCHADILLEVANVWD